ncbi:MAG TPA: universal stress protein [Humidesulfovibrio sp.]|uniref:universal stress protein n=1 Tax=Humidesulfovibrio sp. TaxID=2910988 RepID=UPI002CACC432|nr:universal stress protein [Humidesulfovibrio sp.]HWR03236.1 universal stress protein [Humidesulfovibrio sp.]
MILTFRKILVPMDNSEHSRNALRYALGLAQTQGAHLALLHCFGRIPMLIGGEPRKELVRDLVREAEKLMAPYVKKVRELGLEPALIIKEGRPGEVIVQEAKSGDYDLIVMGTRGLSDMQGVLMGSDAHRVLSAAHCPVLLTR